MLLHNFLGAQLRGLLHGNLLGKPGCRHHAGIAILLSADGARDQIAHRVNHPDRQRRLAVGRDGHGLLGDELGLGRHDGSPRGALGQLVAGTLPLVDVFDVGNDQRLHHPLDKGGLPRPHGTHHPDIDIAAGALRHVLI